MYTVHVHVYYHTVPRLWIADCTVTRTGSFHILMAVRHVCTASSSPTVLDPASTGELCLTTDVIMD